MNQVPMILAPAGGREQFLAAVNAGADAVYLGLGKFNARRRAENFSNIRPKRTCASCSRVRYAGSYNFEYCN